MATKITKTKPTKAPVAADGPNNALSVPKKEDESATLATARVIMKAGFRHGLTAAQMLKPQFGTSEFAPGVGDYADAIGETADAAAKGDLAFASRMLAAQAVTLDTIFGEMARRSGANMGEYMDASERYMRLALKAQANSRATLEALAKLHQPREQTVRHVHVNEGGQAVIADQFHHHAGAKEMPNQPNNPIQPERLASAPRCLARTRSGTECQSPAVKGNQRCRMHGGKGSGAPEGNRNARKHGGYSAETIAAARYLKAIAQQVS